jgi:hypothetical protein
MTPFSGWLQQIGGRHVTPRGIDLGNGRFLGAEDVLEGHFRRLTTRPRTQHVAVQVGDNLMAAITVLAPDLAPLTMVAEGVAGALPYVQPAPDFRLHLHQALERTHRQHAAQRTLGTRPATPPTPTYRPSGRLAALVALMLLAGVAWRWWTQRASTPAVA